MAVEDRQGRAYDEGAFRYFLALEQQRSTRSGRAFLLVLVYLKGKAGAGARIDTTLAAPLFGRLWRCFRESDFIGWYREGRVAGAVLTELRKDAGPASPVSRLGGFAVFCAKGFPRMSPVASTCRCIRSHASRPSSHFSHDGPGWGPRIPETRDAQARGRRLRILGSQHRPQLRESSRLRSGDRLRQEPESDRPGAESPSRRARQRQFR